MPISSRHSPSNAWVRRTSRIAFILLAPLSTAAPLHGATPELQEMLLAVKVNGLALPVTVLLRDPGGRVLARSSDLLRWRFVVANSQANSVTHLGESFLPLDSLPGLHYRVDPATQTLHIDAVATNFLPTIVPGGGRRASIPPPPPLGGFFNYDVSVLSAAHRSSAGGLFQWGGFSRWGALSGNALARSGTDRGQPGGLLRLDTTWTLDRPAELASWRAGDTISRAGAWSQAVRLGGVQYATNFGTQPGFVTFPIPSLNGVAALPSTVDLYVNDVLRMHSDVPAGPFSIPELPVVTGSGETRIVVRDLLGREQTIVAPFYASSQLLQPGLRDFSYEIGALRANFGRASADYGPVVAVATERRGLTDRLTGELHAEIARERQSAGVTVVSLWPAIGVFSTSVATSHSERRNGALMAFGFQRQTRTLSFGGQLVAASERFVPLGLPGDPPAPRQLAQAYASYSTKRHNTVSVNYLHQDLRDRPVVELVGANYAISLGRFGQLSFSLLRAMRGGQTFIGTSFSLPLNANLNLNASVSSRGESRTAQVQVQRNLPVGSGMGYRLAASTGDQSGFDASLLLQNDHGTYGLDTTVRDGHAALRVGASGGFAVIGANAFAGRAISESFLIVDVPDFPGVRVYAANQLVGRTGPDGLMMVPRLLPYQANVIRIEQADLPLDATVDTLQVDVVPNFRSGMLLQFPVRRSRGGLINVLLDDGQPIPVGATARVAGQQEQVFPVVQQGQVYLTGLASENLVELDWHSQRCEIRIPFPDTTDPLPELGTFVCHKVKR